jgi:hypothetical protein
MLIEIYVFQLRDGADEDAFLAADKEAQSELSPARGFVRRTTARGENGNWLVLTFWDGSQPIATTDKLEPFIDPATARTARFNALPG